MCLWIHLLAGATLTNDWCVLGPLGWDNTEMCVLHHFSECSVGLRFSRLCGKCLLFPACSPPCQPQCSFLFCPNKLLALKSLPWLWFWGNPNYDGHQHLIFIYMRVHFFMRKGCSLSQILKGACDSSRMMQSSANTSCLSFDNLLLPSSLQSTQPKSL